jgi:hypothetical protein
MWGQHMQRVCGSINHDTRMHDANDPYTLLVRKQLGQAVYQPHCCSQQHFTASHIGPTRKHARWSLSITSAIFMSCSDYDMGERWSYAAGLHSALACSMVMCISVAMAGAPGVAKVRVGFCSNVHVTLWNLCM